MTFEHVFFRALGSICAMRDIHNDVNAVMFERRGGVLQLPARSLRDQANLEWIDPARLDSFAEVADESLPSDDKHPVFPQSFFTNRANNNYLGIFVGPIEIGSIKDRYREYISAEYPGPANPNPPLDLVAGAALRLIDTFCELRLERGALIDYHSTERLKKVLDILRDAYLKLGNTEISWNVLWMLHVDEGLRQLAIAVEANGIADPIFLRRAIFPCFSLPNPEVEDYKAGNILANAIQEFWCDEETINRSLDKIEKNNSSKSGQSNSISYFDPLRGIQWDEFDMTKSLELNGGRGSPLLAFAIHNSDGADRWMKFESLLEDDFFNPTCDPPDEIEFALPNYEPIHDRSFAKGFTVIGPSIISSDPAFSDRSLRSMDVIAFLPVYKAGATSSMITASTVGLVQSGDRIKNRIHFKVTDRQLNADGRVELHGFFWWKIKQTGDFIHEVEIKSIKIEISPNDQLTQFIEAYAKANVALLAADGAGLILVPDNGRISRSIFIGQTEFAFDGNCKNLFIDLAVEVAEGSRYQAIIWSAKKPIIVSKDETNLTISDGVLPHVFDHVFDKLVEIQIDSVKITVEAELEYEIDQDLPSSPLRAATEHTECNPDCDELVMADIRWRLESVLVNKLSLSENGKSIGQIVLTCDLGEHIEDVEFHEKTQVFVPSVLIQPHVPKWPINPGDAVDADLLASNELRKFHDSFRALELIDLLSKSNQRLISKVELPLHLARVAKRNGISDWHQLLDEYLESFDSLIRRADRCSDHYSKFWARFPFSALIFSTVQDGKLVGAMLSPFHPLRFGWLVNAEDVLRRSNQSLENRRMLSGTIAGWQFPILSRSNTPNGALIAIPTDGGPESLFSGWSMLVPASVDNPAAVSVPRFAGDCQISGVSANGLDASAVEGALDDFYRANPFISTLVIDLAASSLTPRTESLDLGLILKLKQWTAKRVENGLSPGGIRVYDSLNRLGDVHQEVGGLLNPELSVRAHLTWRRYKPTSNSELNVNLRVITDSGVKVDVQNEGKRIGVVSNVPLRRFDVTAVNRNANTSFVQPEISNEILGSFVGALRAMEAKNSLEMDGGRLIQHTVAQNNAMATGADWTVMGESGIAPSALASILGARNDGSTPVTLWEWRPPFFEINHKGISAAVDRRPYLTVAKIPKIFTSNTKRLVNLLMGGNASTADLDLRVSKTIATLGARGVGLSSLIGGKHQDLLHQKGALGFATVFELIDRAQKEDIDRFVVPIDACNRYIKMLGGVTTSKDKMADLLIIELRQSELIFVPVEIKFYKLEDPVGSLPNAGDDILSESILQAGTTWSQLQGLKRAWENSRSEDGTRELMDNAIAALVDVAIRLTPISEAALDRVRDGLSKLVAGGMNIVVGKPLISFQIATDDSLKSRQVTCTFDHCDYAIYIADMRSIRTELDGVEGKALADWKLALDSAFDIGCFTTVINNISQPAVLISPIKEDLSPVVSPVVSPLVEVTNDDGVVYPGTKFEIGQFADSGDVASYWPGNTNLNSLNIGVLGDMGTGKTQLCLGLVMQLRRASRKSQPKPVTGLILDYKRDYQKPEFLKAVGARVLTPHHMPLDVFEIIGEKTSVAITKCANSFINIISMIFTGIGVQQQDRLRRVIIDLIRLNRQSPTMSDVATAYSLAIDRRFDGVTNTLNNFVQMEIFGNRPEEFQSLEEMLREGVVVVDLRYLEGDEQLKKTLIAVFINKYFDYMIKLTKWPYYIGGAEALQLRRLNSFLLVDEAVNIMQFEFDPLNQILLQGREYGSAVILSSQYLDHFNKTAMDYAQPLRTWFVHRVPRITKRELEQLGMKNATDQIARQIPSLSIHQNLYASFDCDGKVVLGHPFFRQLEQLSESEKDWNNGS